MDFLKACTTNLHVVENLLQTRFCLYRWKDDYIEGLEKRGQTHDIVATLREQNVLCSSEEDGIWVFGDIGDELKHILNTNHASFLASDEGMVEDQSAEQNDAGKPVKDILLDAVEGAIAFSLAQHSSVYRIGPWKWLCCSRDEDDVLDQESTIIHLHARLAPTGTLYLAPQLHQSPWSSMGVSAVDITGDVILSPYGTSANVFAGDDEEKSILSGTTWRANVRQALRIQGLEISDEDQWETVQLADDSSGEAFEWPIRLCLICTKATKISQSAIEGEDWRRWFSGASDGDAFRNPLVAAEEWFKSAADRESAAQQTNQVDTSANGIDDSTTPAVAGMPVNGNDASFATSPNFNQRHLEQQTAMAGIYPTPPDGLAQGQQSTQLNSATTPSVTQADLGPLSNDLLPTSDDAQFKSHDFGALAEPESLPESYQMGQEDLFGDVGEIEFGENEVGDADFSFFDEPDDEPVAPPSEDAEMQEATEVELQDGLDTMMPAESKETQYEDSNALPAEAPVVDDDPIEDTKPAAMEDAKTTEEEETAVEEDLPPAPQFAEPEKPLSPFGIRERLLPPPVPASMAHNGNLDTVNQRRNSTFSPIAFRDGFNLAAKYADANIPKDVGQTGKIRPNQASITLPPTRKKSRVLKKDEESDEDDESEEDSYESSSSESDEGLPPKLPWDNRKRKRRIDQDSMYPLETDRDADNGSGPYVSQETMVAVLEKCSTSPNDTGMMDRPGLRFDVSSNTTTLDSVPSIEDVYDLRKEDFSWVAQIIGHQAATTFDLQSPFNFGSSPLDNSPVIVSDLETLLNTSLGSVLPDMEVCDLSKVASTREPPPRAMTNSGKAAQGQPRPPPRPDSVALGPDYFPLAAPYIRVQRGGDSWEMLPASLSFWEPLGLAPASGPKNVRAYCVFPNNEDLQQILGHFIADLGNAYESCKLGNHAHLRNVSGKDDLDSYEDGMAPVDLSNETSLEEAFKSYADTCAELGKALSSISHRESDRTIVVYLVNPFKEPYALHHLCACFFMLFKAYRDNFPKAQRNQCSSDIVLQVIPIDVVASFDALVVPDARRMAMLAREVYDRCPPSTSYPIEEGSSPLAIADAPSVELASAAPKRIGFQLAAEPPCDLLHEGSILHIAYARSRDGQWLTAVWIDNTGRHQASISYCLRGKSFANIADDVWERTREIMAARQVTWRIFILTHESLSRAVSQCWRSLCTKPRQQPLCVTMLTVQIDPVIQLSPPLATLDTSLLSKDGQDAGFLTPASTPQGNNFTSSPDVSGHTNAPLTPGPSETAASVLDNDPDAHLADITDETWGCMLSPKLAQLSSITGLANGALFKRGDVDTTPIGPGAAVGEKLPSLGVSLHWTIQVKPSGGVDEGSVRQAELTLREVLKMYRNLALLTRMRGFEKERTDFVPVHVACAIRGARALDGLFPPVKE